MNQLCPLLNELGHDADRNFRHAARTDSDSHWTDHAPQLFLGCEVFVAEVLEEIRSTDVQPKLTCYV